MSKQKKKIKKNDRVNVKEKVVLITGGSKGIGRETAKQFAKNGAFVVITGRRKEELEKTCEIINSEYGKCEYFQGDVTSQDDCARIVNAVYRIYHRLDILINNAGMTMRGTFQQTSLNLFRKINDINFMGAVYMTKFALEYLIKSQGSVIFISSIAGLKGLPQVAPYGTSKMALTSFSESLRAELYQYHVHVGIVYVGFTENDLDKTAYTATGDRMSIARSKSGNTQNGVARSIYKVVLKRKHIVYLTFLGKITQRIYRYFPRISNFVLLKFAMKSEMYR
jgi:dehydrogenase/reductase SDR family member 7B